MIISHRGVKGTVNNNRNLSDEQLRRIAAKGGLIGIGFWEEAIGPITDLKATVRAIRHAVKVTGINNIALDSDSDIAFISMPFNAFLAHRSSRRLHDRADGKRAKAAFVQCKGTDDLPRLLLEKIAPNEDSLDAPSHNDTPFHLSWGAGR